MVSPSPTSCALDNAISAPVADPGDEAHIFTSALATLQARKGREVLEVDVNDKVGALTVEQRATIERQLAAAMVGQLRG
jgi:hypothetical protein